MKPVIIDVREAEEFASGHVDGALHIPPSELMAGAPALADIPKDSKIIVYCRTGARSNAAMHMLRSLGFNNLTNGINKDQVEARFLR